MRPRLTWAATLVARFVRRRLDLSPDEVSFARRGFCVTDEAARLHLEDVGRTFVYGYNAALAEDGMGALALRLGQVPATRRGFAFEGAAMALTLLDLLFPWRRQRLQAFLIGPGRPHTYLVHVGAGWALARLPLPTSTLLRRLDPLLRWLALDGFGFHEGFFRWPHSVSGQRVPRRLRGYARRAFDQGLGRSLWFVEGAGSERIAATIAAFPLPRRADLWSGVGLGCAYAGGVRRGAIEHLRELAGEHLPQVAQGAAFAAKARQVAGDEAPHTEMACEVLCGTSAATAAEVTEVAEKDLAARGVEPIFETWRCRIQERFETREDAACSSATAFSAAAR